MTCRLEDVDVCRQERRQVRERRKIHALVCMEEAGGVCVLYKYNCMRLCAGLTHP